MLKNKTIDQITKLHESELDDMVRGKAKLVLVAEQIQKRIQELITQMQEEAVVAHNNQDVSHTFVSYYQASKDKLSTLAQELVKVQLEIDMITDAIMQVHVEIKKYERLKELSAAKAEKAELAQEQKDLDEYNITNLT